jgi:carbamoyltransferase
MQPAAGDAGGALGAAYAVWHQYLGNGRPAGGSFDSQQGSYLGPEYAADEIEAALTKRGATFSAMTDEELITAVAKLLSEGAVVGWMSGRMEFGPRALGARSILGDPRDRGMQKRMNLKIKHRESFRPFAPAVLAEEAQNWFDLDVESPYMMLVASVREEHRIAMSEEESHLFGIDKLNVPRSTIPAVTHIDYSARVQTVHRETNPRFHALIEAFRDLTGCPILVNTSFNVRGEPIVCTPDEAYRCFVHTEMDALVIGQCLLLRKEQIRLAEAREERHEFELD